MRSTGVTKTVPARPVTGLFLTAGLLGIVSLLVPHDPVTDDGPLLAVSAASVLVGAGLLRRTRISLRDVGVLLVAGTVMASAAILVTGGPPNASAALYTWICLYAAYVLPTRAAVLQAAGCATAYAIVLAVDPPPFPPFAHWTTTVGSLVGATVLVATLRTRLDDTIDELERTVRTDALTGLANRRHLAERLEHELARSARDGRPVALVLADIDHFKVVNDTYGHPVGDVVLRLIADVLRSELRPQDLAARHGGEELAFVLPGAGEVEAEVVAERLRREVERRTPLEGPCGVTLSFGVASGTGSRATAAGLLRAADLALYAAKAGGRNCTRSTPAPVPA